MKFEILGNISKLEILLALKYTIFNKKIKTAINSISKISDSILIEYKNHECKIIPQSFIRDFKTKYILDNISNIDDEIKITIDLINKKLNNN